MSSKASKIGLPTTKDFKVCLSLPETITEMLIHELSEQKARKLYNVYTKWY